MEKECLLQSLKMNRTLQTTDHSPILEFKQSSNLIIQGYDCFHSSHRWTQLDRSTSEIATGLAMAALSGSILTNQKIPRVDQYRPTLSCNKPVHTHAHRNSVTQTDRYAYARAHVERCLKVSVLSWPHCCTVAYYANTSFNHTKTQRITLHCITVLCFSSHTAKQEPG